MPDYSNQFLFIYLFIINIIALLAFRVDKKLSKTHHRRISEQTLLTMAVLGGSLGALFGMLLYRHKTKKPKFQIGVPVILLVQSILYYYFMK